MIGAEDCGIEGIKGEDGFDREVGAVGNPSQLLKELAVGISPPESFFPQPFSGPLHVAGGVGRLY